MDDEKIELAKRMLDQVVYYELEDQAWLGQFTVEQMAEDFNGIGPAWFPEKLRKAMDKLSADLLCVAFVHDVRWSHSDGSLEFFTKSNGEFRENGYKVAKKKYGWWRPRRYLLMREAKLFSELCERFGWSAYCEAKEKKV